MAISLQNLLLLAILLLSSSLDSSSIIIRLLFDNSIISIRDGFVAHAFPVTSTTSTMMKKRVPWSQAILSPSVQPSSAASTSSSSLHFSKQKSYYQYEHHHGTIINDSTAHPQHSPSRRTPGPTSSYYSFSSSPTTSTTQLNALLIATAETATTTATAAASMTLASASTTAAVTAAGLADYAPAATSLFNNMKLPAAVVTAGMISLGFATSFPELPRETDLNKHIYPPNVRRRCDALKRLHIVVALIAITSELIVVLWSAVEVNQLTEKQYAPALSVWDLIQRDCDLAWSAVNSHFVLGIIGFIIMLSLRAYVLLVAAEASSLLMAAASTGTVASLCLMISIVNRGVESGGGNGIDRYGNTILDLVQHYVTLLAENALGTEVTSPGPLQLAAIALEITSLFFLGTVLLFQSGKTEYNDADSTVFEETEEGVGLVIDMDSSFGTVTATAIKQEEEKAQRQQKLLQEEEEEERQRQRDSDDTSVSMSL